MATIWPQNWVDLPLAVIDVETTGLDPVEDRIVEIGIIRFENREVVERYCKLINPERDLPEETTEITGIKPEDLVGAPIFSEIAGEVSDRLQGVGLVAYNLSFDRSFIQNELERCGLTWPDASPTLDPLIFARQFFKDSRRKNLATISSLLGIPLEEAHRADHDAEVAGKVLFAFEDKLPQSLDQLLILQGQWEAAQAQAMSGWKSFDNNFASLGGAEVGLGPAYIYGDETDPLRALFTSVPEAPDPMPQV